MLDSDHIRWLQRLSGYTESMIHDAVDRVERWNPQRLSDELGVASGAAGHLAATMLCQAVDWLANAGVDESRLKAKLKRPDTWSMWAEIRAAGLIAHLVDGVHGVELDVPVGPGSRRNTDFGFRVTGQPDILPVEFKALGLSDLERRFCRSWAPTLRSIEPVRGICTLHADIDTPPLVINRRQRRQMCREVARNAKRIPSSFGTISATVVVASGTQGRYVQRLTTTVNEHLSQLPDSCEGWIAFHWSDGTEPLWPFNLLLAPDPIGVEET